MSRFLFVVPPFFGHISPTLSIGSSLIARGHEVKWIGITPLAAKHIPEGGEFIYPEADLSEHQEEIDRILDKISQSGYESLSKQEKEILFRASNNES